jgi:GAF domain-containing protein
MKRRSRTGREASKTRRREALKTKRRDASKTVSLSAPIPADPEVARLTRELSEALERQAATSEVLQIISESPGDLQPVLTSMLENAVRICGATFGNIYRWDGEALHMLASHNTPPAFAEDRRRSPYRPYPKSPVGRMLVTKRLVHISDVMAEDVYTKKLDCVAVTAVTLGGIRTLLGVPLLNKGEMIGVFFLSRQEVRPFTDKQIGLVENFAAQAVVAIENTRLLNELRQSLERQTATSEVLQVISASPGDLEPVFASVLENAVRICDAKFGSINRWDGEALHLVATHKLPPAFAEFRRRTPFRPGPENPISRMLMTKTIIHFHDLAAEQGYIERDPTFVAAVELGGVRTFLAVPMLKENELIGVVIVYRQEVRPFTDKQIDLVKNFAAQAVIAIENARLLNELRQRTDDLSQRTTDLTESLEQQTATSEVLQVISSFPGDVQPVFEAMLEKAVRICDAKFGSLYLHENGRLRLVAAHGVPEFFEARRGVAFEPAPGSPLDEAMKKKRTTQIADLAATEPYRERHPGMVDAVELAGIRTGVDVPMLKEDELIGILAIHRREVLPFTEKQIELLTNFAAQAVIAIENARLLKELRERTEEVEAQSQELLKLNEQLEQRVADQVGEIERMGRLRRFLPPQVADLIVASGTEKQLESHRREITALFCDLRGFTGFTESADAEDVMALLREYHAAIGEIIIKYSGTLERYAGDGVMVVFNDPIPVDNPALQAVQMALEMRGAISELTEKWRQLGHEIGFGIGIAHGYATLGTIGFEGRFDYAAIGTVSNVASRLCDEARPGQILISPRVLMAVRDAVTVEAVGEFELKGIRRPIAAYNVVAALPPSP